MSSKAIHIGDQYELRRISQEKIDKFYLTMMLERGRAYADELFGHLAAVELELQNQKELLDSYIKALQGYIENVKNIKS